MCHYHHFLLHLFQCLRKWGFRRCEDICWIKTNKNNPGKTKALDPKAVFQRTKVDDILLKCELYACINVSITLLIHRLDLNFLFRVNVRHLQEHCLMGIKGTVRRSTDGDFIHANVDIDLIITEEPEMGNVEKPVEIFHIIEHFCLGRRRLHLFGRDSTIRPGKTDPLIVRGFVSVSSLNTCFVFRVFSLLF